MVRMVILEEIIIADRSDLARYCLCLIELHWLNKNFESDLYVVNNNSIVV